MSSINLSLVLPWCFLGVISSATVTRYQQKPLPMCAENTVCSEITELPALGDDGNYFSWEMCRCPGNSVCPRQPGENTMPIGNDKWYGMCRPASTIRTCEVGEIAEEYFVGVRQVPYSTFTTVHCMCPSLEFDPRKIREDDAWQRARRSEHKARAVYQLICADNNTSMETIKRQSRFGSNPRSRFYFYRR